MASTRDRSLKHETRIAKRMTEAGLPTRVTVNSGAMPFDLGDGVNSMFCYDAKLRGGKGFRVDGEMLDKLKSEALFGRNGGRIPVLPFCLEEHDPSKDWYIIEDYHFYGLVRGLLLEELRAHRLEIALKNLLKAGTADEARQAISEAAKLVD